MTYDNYQEKVDFERALRIATAQVNSDGDLIAYDSLEAASKDEAAGSFAISLDELYRFYLIVKSK